MKQIITTIIALFAINSGIMAQQEVDMNCLSEPCNWVCEGMQISPYNIPTTLDGEIVSWEWNLGDIFLNTFNNDQLNLEEPIFDLNGYIGFVSINVTVTNMLGQNETIERPSIAYIEPLLYLVNQSFTICEEDLGNETIYPADTIIYEYEYWNGYFVDIGGPNGFYHQGSFAFTPTEPGSYWVNVFSFSGCGGAFNVNITVETCQPDYQLFVNECVQTGTPDCGFSTCLTSPEVVQLMAPFQMPGTFEPVESVIWFSPNTETQNTFQTELNAFNPILTFTEPGVYNFVALLQAQSGDLVEIPITINLEDPNFEWGNQSVGVCDESLPAVFVFSDLIDIPPVYSQGYSVAIWDGSTFVGDETSTLSLIPGSFISYTVVVNSILNGCSFEFTFDLYSLDCDPCNNPTVCNDIIYCLDSGSDVTVDLTQWCGADGEISLELISPSANGITTLLNGDGLVHHVPNGPDAYPDSFTVQMIDETGNCYVRNVILNATPNTPEPINGETVFTACNQSIDFEVVEVPGYIYIWDGGVAEGPTYSCNVSSSNPNCSHTVYALDENGCQSNSITFYASNNCSAMPITFDCIGTCYFVCDFQEIQLIPPASSLDGNIVAWQWDLGDDWLNQQYVEELTSPTPIVQLYGGGIAYSISIELTNEFGETELLSFPNYIMVEISLYFNESISYCESEFPVMVSPPNADIFDSQYWAGYDVYINGPNGFNMSQWNDLTFEAPEGGTYWIDVISVQSGCISNYQLDITTVANPNAPQPLSGSYTTTVCNESFVTFEVVENPDEIYQWSNGEIGPIATCGFNGDDVCTLSVQATNANGCVSEWVTFVGINDCGAGMADLSLTKTVDNGIASEGDLVTFTITVNNAGPSVATNVSVTDLLPSGIEFVSNNPSQGVYDQITGEWTVGTIGVNTSITLDIVVLYLQPTTVTNIAEVTSSDQVDPDSTPDNGVASEDDQDGATVEPADCTNPTSCNEENTICIPTVQPYTICPNTCQGVAAPVFTNVVYSTIGDITLNGSECFTFDADDAWTTSQISDQIVLEYVDMNDGQCYEQSYWVNIMDGSVFNPIPTNGQTTVLVCNEEEVTFEVAEFFGMDYYWSDGQVGPTAICQFNGDDYCSLTVYGQNADGCTTEGITFTAIENCDCENPITCTELNTICIPGVQPYIICPETCQGVTAPVFTNVLYSTIGDITLNGSDCITFDADDAWTTSQITDQIVLEYIDSNDGQCYEQSYWVNIMDGSVFNPTPTDGQYTVTVCDEEEVVFVLNSFAGVEYYWTDGQVGPTAACQFNGDDVCTLSVFGQNIEGCVTEVITFTAINDCQPDDCTNAISCPDQPLICLEGFNPYTICPETCLTDFEFTNVLYGSGFNISPSGECITIEAIGTPFSDQILMELIDLNTNECYVQGYWVSANSEGAFSPELIGGGTSVTVCDTEETVTFEIEDDGLFYIWSNSTTGPIATCNFNGDDYCSLTLWVEDLSGCSCTEVITFEAYAVSCGATAQLDPNSNLVNCGSGTFNVQVIDQGGEYHWSNGSVGTSATYNTNQTNELIMATVWDASNPGSPTVFYLYNDVNCVWPGDCDYDGEANIYDVLNIGIAFGSGGYARNNASTLWQPQACIDWGLQFANNVNTKHADCNGNGVVENADVGVVDDNYGLTHGKADLSETSTDGIPLYIDFEEEVVEEGDVVNADIILGTPDEMAQNVYGLAFSIYYDSYLVQDETEMIDFAGSWLGTEGFDMVTLTKIFPEQGRIDVALVRNDQQSQSGSGLIFSASFVMIDDVEGKKQAAAEFTATIANVKLINNMEELLEVGLPEEPEIVIVNATTSTNPLFETSIEFGPNPFNNYLNINLQDLDEEVKISIYSITGQKVIEENVSGGKITITTDNLSQGLYLIHLESASLNHVAKLEKLK